MWLLFYLFANVLNKQMSVLTTQNIIQAAKLCDCFSIGRINVMLVFKLGQLFSEHTLVRST